MLRWRLRRLLRFWQAHTAGCAAGRQALERMATGAEQRAVSAAFTAWRSLVAQRQERLASLTALVASRQRQRAQQAAFQGWRLLVDDSYGARLQAQHAQQVLGRLRLRSIFRVSWGGKEPIDRQLSLVVLADCAACSDQLPALLMSDCPMKWALQPGSHAVHPCRHGRSGSSSAPTGGSAGRPPSPTCSSGAQPSTPTPSLRHGSSMWRCGRRNGRCCTSEWV